MADGAQFIAIPKSHFTTIVNADGTAMKASWTTAEVKGGLIRGINFATDNTADLAVGVYIRRGGVDYLQCVVNVPAGAGASASVSAVNALDPQWMPFLDQEPNRALFMEADDILYFNVGVAVVATKTLYISAFGGVY